MSRQYFVISGLVLIGAVASSVYAQRRPVPETPEQAKKMEENRALQGDGVSVGEPAPDFDLKLLRAYDLGLKDAEGNEPDSIKLSQFKGDKPVVLIFGSYT